MNLNDYCNPVDMTLLSVGQNEKQNKFSFCHIDKDLNNISLKKYDVAIIGVPEERNTDNKGTALAPDIIRQELYKLNQLGKLRIIDLGNLKTGHSLKDTYIAVSELVHELIKHQVIPVVIGGSQDLTYGLYLACDKLNQQIKLVSIDPKFDLGYKKDDFDSNSYLGQIILEKGKNLFNYTNLGYQSYYCNKDELSLLNKMNFDAYRLGQIRANLADFEPVLRDSNILSIDISAIKQSDAPAHKNASPNGFYSEEICQLVRYAGVSDNLQVFGLFDVNPDFDTNYQTSRLAAQIIWYFIDGVNARQKDFPETNSPNYTKFIVSFEKTEQNIIFFQNNYNKRWWMEVPYPGKSEKNMIVACTYNDYLTACNQELPDRWLKTIQKLN